MSGEENLGALSSLLSNPAALSSIASLLSNMQQNAPTTAQQYGADGSDKDAESVRTDCSKAEGDCGANGGPGGNTDGNTGAGGGPGGIFGSNEGAGKGGVPDLSGIMSALSNPAVMSTLSSLAPMLFSLSSNQSTAKIPPFTSGGSGAGAQNGTGGLRGIGNNAACARPVYPTDRRCALLLALKPYMPEDKQSAIDTVVRVIEIMSAIK